MQERFHCVRKFTCQCEVESCTVHRGMRASIPSYHSIFHLRASVLASSNSRTATTMSPSSSSFYRTSLSLSSPYPSLQGFAVYFPYTHVSVKVIPVSCKCVDVDSRHEEQGRPMEEW